MFDVVPNLKKFFGSENKIQLLPVLRTDKPSYLEHLDLRSNQIFYLDDQFMTSLPYLQYLDLSNNQLETLPESILKSSFLKKVHIEKNPLNCDCRSYCC